jgi:TM2 domain-containing membrane protein YozV
LNKNPVLAFLLSFLPGLGHLYVGRKIRAFIYGCGFFGPVALGFIFATTGGHSERDMAVICLIFSLLFAVINIIDMIIYLSSHKTDLHSGSAGYGHPTVMPHQDGVSFGDGMPVQTPETLYAQTQRHQNERFFTTLLSFIPGLGHFQLGLMQRGLTFLVGFFGLIIMIVFVTAVTNVEGFFVFLLALPVIVLYSVFDAAQMLHRKQKGEELVDRTIFEELELTREDGRKSRIIAILLSVFPGAGHMYLGLQRRGLQLMAAFLFAIYIMDVLRLSIFLFLIPILWFYSLFDAMQLVSKQQKDEELKDIPLVNWLFNHQKWLGFGLLALGVYYLFDRMLLRLLEEALPDLRISYWLHNYLQIFIVSTLLIGGGFRLLWGGSRPKKENEAQ